MASVPPTAVCWSRAHKFVCHRVAERHSGTGKPAVEPGDASHVNTLLLPSIVVQARLGSAKVTLMLVSAAVTAAWGWQ